MSIRNTGCAAILVLFAAGCASAPQYAPITPLPAGSRVNLTVEVPELASPDAKDGSESVGGMAARGAGVGAGAGAVAGLEGSLACGPFVVLCAPIAAVAGAGVGAVIGTVGGAAKGTAVALPAEKAKAVESIIDSTLAETDIAALLEDEFLAHNEDRWQLVSEGATNSVTIGIDALYLQQATGDELAVELQSYVRMRYGPNEDQQTKKIIFRSTSDRYHVDHWIEDDGNALRREIIRSFAEVTRQMNAALVQQPQDGGH